VEDMAAAMADIAVATAGTAGTVANMPRPLMLRGKMLVFVVAVGVPTMLSGARAAARATQGAHITRPAAVIGEVITDIPDTV
jgi:hypothetical protein